MRSFDIRSSSFSRRRSGVERSRLMRPVPARRRLSSKAPVGKGGACGPRSVSFNSAAAPSRLTGRVLAGGDKLLRLASAFNRWLDLGVTEPPAAPTVFRLPVARGCRFGSRSFWPTFASMILPMLRKSLMMPASAKISASATR